MLRLPFAALAALPAVVGAQPPAAQQIAAAVLPLPAEFRASASVLGYGADGKLGTLRNGAGPYVCLAADPKRPEFHVACYHRSLEPFMARGRALRAQGVTGERGDSARFAEVMAGATPESTGIPAQPAAGKPWLMFPGTPKAHIMFVPSM